MQPGCLCTLAVLCLAGQDVRGIQINNKLVFRCPCSLTPSKTAFFWDARGRYSDLLALLGWGDRQWWSSMQFYPFWGKQRVATKSGEI